MRVLIYVCGEGLGHTTRCMSAGRELAEAGHEVVYGAYGYSKDLLEKTGHVVRYIPAEIQLLGDSGAFGLGQSIKATVKNPVVFRSSAVFRLLREARPDVVISDMYYLGMLAAKLRGIPTHVITNQTNMIEFFQNQGLIVKAIGELAKAFYTTVFSCMDSIIIPDFPPPHAICRRSIQHSRAMEKKLFYCGPLVRRKYPEVRAEKTRRPHVLSTVGGFGYRHAIFEKTIEAAKLDSSISYTLMLGPSVDAREFGSLPSNVRTLESVDDPLAYIKGSDLVVSSGGHSTIMEALSFGVPVLSFPDLHHNEQENNALALEGEGVGGRVSYSATPEELLGHIKEALTVRSFKDNALKFRKMAEGLGGPAAVRKLLESGRR